MFNKIFHAKQNKMDCSSSYPLLLLYKLFLLNLINRQWGIFHSNWRRWIYLNVNISFIQYLKNKWHNQVLESRKKWGKLLKCYIIYFFALFYLCLNVKKSKNKVVWTKCLGHAKCATIDCYEVGQLCWLNHNMLSSIIYGPHCGRVTC